MDVDDCSDSRLNSVSSSDKHQGWFTGSLSRRSRLPLALALSSHRIHVRGRVEGYHVPRVTIGTASDVPCTSSSFIERQVLKNEPVDPIPHAAIELKAANGSLMEVRVRVRVRVHPL